MEGGHEPELIGSRTGTGYGARLSGALIAGALSAGLIAAGSGFLLEALGPATGPGLALGYRRFLLAGGWLWLPLWGMAVAAALAVAWAPSRRSQVTTLGLALLLSLLPIVLRPSLPALVGPVALRSPQAKARAILKWSYQAPQGVAKILALSRDADPRVREQAMLALGVNLIVTDIEHAGLVRPSQYASHPLRDSLRARLGEAMKADPVEAVRAEAARALWKAPITFGHEPAAAETLSAVLDRSLRPGAVERLSWLALDAAAGTPDRALKAAAARFALSTPDSDLARAARQAARPYVRPDSGFRPEHPL